MHTSPHEHHEVATSDGSALKGLQRVGGRGHLVRLLEDEAWSMQERLPGERVLVTFDGETAFARNAQGEPVPLPPTVAQSLALWREYAPLALDAVMGGSVLTVYDVLQAGGESWSSIAYSERLKSIRTVLHRDLAANPSCRALAVAHTALNRTGKQRLYAALSRYSEGGAVFRHLGVGEAVVYEAAGPLARLPQTETI